MEIHDLDKLSLAIDDLHRRLQSLRVAIINNDREILDLLELQILLKENITELKKNYVVAMAYEYKRAKDDLKRTEVRLSFLRMEQLTYDKAWNGQIGMMNHLQSLYEQEFKRQSKVVVKGNFGRKNG